MKEAGHACDRLNSRRDELKQEPVYIWAREFTDNRGRDFVVQEPSIFWDKYKRMQSSQQTFYELIRTDEPCKFYLDLEFSKPLNPNVDGDTMMEHVRHHVKDIFLTKLGVILKSYSEPFIRQPYSLGGMILELDASNDVKFSRHLVVLLHSGCLFRNVKHVKDFAECLHLQLWILDCRVTKRVAGQL